MSFLRNLYFLLFIPVLLSLTFCTSSNNLETDRPNILIILVDDMGFGDLAMAGNPYLTTPNLDALRQKSVSFEHFYVSPVCAPTRASLLTGLYHQKTGVRSVTNGFESMHTDASTLAELLQPIGYQSGLFGKWHLGEYYPMVPQGQGFDEFIGFRTGHTAHYFDPALEHNGETRKFRGYITDILTKEALNFMQASSSPFFCLLSLNAPHTPLQIDSSYFLSHLKAGLDERSARVYGMMENVDENVGLLLQSLEQTDKLRETIVIFMSDNGPINGWRVPQQEMRFNAGLRDQKFTVFEGGIRTQAFWYWKDHWKTQHVPDILAAHIDVVPTILDIISVPALHFKMEMDGLSLVPVLGGKTTSTLKNRMFFQQYDLSNLREPAPLPGGIALQWPWKMVNDTALYRLDQDIGESTNLHQKHPEILQGLSQAYHNWWNSLVLDTLQFGMTIPIGHEEENPILLQAHHGIALGEIKFLGQRGLLGERIGSHPSGVDGDWLSNWHLQGDGIKWQLDFQQKGRYEIAVVGCSARSHQEITLDITVNQKKHTVDIQANSLSTSWQSIPLLELDLENRKDILSVELNHPISTRDSFEMKGIRFRRIAIDTL